MDKTVLSNLLIIIPSVISVLALIKTILLIKENRLLAGQLTETSMSLQMNLKKFNDYRNRYDDVKNFQHSLTEAEITTTLQKPRTENETIAQQNSFPKSIPEKYSIVHSLAEKGMDENEISNILSLSTDEVEQIITLRKLAVPL